MADGDDETVKLLREIRDLQQKTLDAQRQLLMFLLPIFALMTIATILGLAGIDERTPDPTGGVIERDARGVATGLLKETAQDLVKKVLPPYTAAEVKQAQMEAAGWTRDGEKEDVFQGATVTERRYRKHLTTSA